MRSDIVIIGAGLSGLSCAVSLVEKGYNVLLLEAHKAVGGRTASWEQNGMLVESGLHRYLGFYEALPQLLETCGVHVDDIVCWEDEIEIRIPGKSAVFGLSPSHKPLESLASLLSNNDFVAPQDKARLMTFFSRGFVEMKQKPEELDAITVYDYARRHGLSEEAILRVIVPLTEGLFFLSHKTYSAYNLFALFAPYLSKLHKMRVGAFMGGMTQVMADPIRKYIEKKGGTVRTDTRVEELMVEDGKVRGVVCNGEQIKADQVVLATPLWEAQQLMKRDFQKHPWIAPILSLKTMPSVTAQIELREPSMDVDRTTFSPGTVLASYAEQSRTTFRKSKGRLSIILGSPQQFLRMRHGRIMQMILDDVKKLGLNISRGKIKDYRIIKWRHDFYSYKRGSAWLRPEQRTPIEGLVLAGDYTRQEYLSTMEGAVVSGQKAAQVVSNA